MTTTSWRLGGIEALRGLAAVSVIFYHVSRHVNHAFASPDLVAAFQSGHAGVDLFFVISGFIIMFVHGRDVGQPQRLGHYVSRRVTRVMPLYWVALAVTVAMALAAGRGLPDLATFLQSALLLPLHDPILGIAWTLQYEAVFYAMFAVLILHRLSGMLLLAGWFCWVAMVAAQTGGVDGSPLEGDYILQFGLGMGAAALARRAALPAPRLLAAGGALAFVAAMLLENAGLLNGYATPARLAYGLSAAVLVLGLAGMERRGALGVPGWLRQLGGASYSIYLFQYVFISVAWQGWQVLRLGTVTPAWLCFLALSATAIGGGLLVAWMVEKPLLRRVRDWQARRNGSQAAMAASAVSAKTSATTTPAPSTSPV